MPRRLIFVAILCTTWLSGGPDALASPDTPRARTTQGSAAARAGVEAAIEHYFRGHATGEPAHMRKAFLPTAHIEGVRDGVFTSWTLDEYCALFDGKSASDEEGRARSIDFIDVSGDAALARATLDHGDIVFTDYFVLLEVDGEWRIANKVYHGRPD